MADEEILYGIPKINPNTFNQYVNQYFNEYLTNLSITELYQLIQPVLKGLPFAYYIDIQNWPSLDGYAASGTTKVPGGAVLYLATGTNANDFCKISSGYNSHNMIRDGKTIIIDWYIDLISDVTSSERIVALGHADNYIAPSTPPVDGDSFLGFYIDDGRIHTITGDGVDLTITDTLIDCISHEIPFHLTAVLKNDEAAYFYVNNVLAAVHTTNLPGQGVLGTGWFYTWWVRTKAASSRNFYIGRTMTINTYPE